ncbi:hypothetical protein HK096_006415 [Nowakowskiella sp. JEL0078]|nr:hypothetical protein HK096_006415 [Nowakowskiella sp. JEL0078]
MSFHEEEVVSLADLQNQHDSDVAIPSSRQYSSGWGEPPAVTPFFVVSKLSPLNSWHSPPQNEIPPVTSYNPHVAMHNRNRSWSYSSNQSLQNEIDPPQSNYNTSATTYNYFANNPHSHAPRPSPPVNYQNFSQPLSSGGFPNPLNPNDTTIYSPQQQPYASPMTGIYQTYSQHQPQFQQVYQHPNIQRGRSYTFNGVQSSTIQTAPFASQGFHQSSPRQLTSIGNQNRSRSTSLGIVNYPDFQPAQESVNKNPPMSNKLQSLLSKVSAAPFYPSFSDGATQPDYESPPSLMKQPSVGFLNASQARFAIRRKNQKNIIDLDGIITTETFKDGDAKFSRFGVVQVLNEFLFLPNSSMSLLENEDTEVIQYISKNKISMRAESEETLTSGTVAVLSAGSGKQYTFANNSLDSSNIVQFQFKCRKTSSNSAFSTRVVSQTSKQNRLVPLVVPLIFADVLSKKDKKGQFMGSTIEKLLKCDQDLYLFGAIIDGGRIVHRPLGPNRKVLVHILQSDQAQLNVRVNETIELLEGDTLVIDNAAISDRIDIFADGRKVEILVLDFLSEGSD